MGLLSQYSDDTDHEIIIIMITITIIIIIAIIIIITIMITIHLVREGVDSSKVDIDIRLSLRAE